MVFRRVSEPVTSVEPLSQTVMRAGRQHSCFMKRKSEAQELRAGAQSWLVVLDSLQCHCLLTAGLLSQPGTPSWEETGS